MRGEENPVTGTKPGASIRMDIREEHGLQSLLTDAVCDRWVAIDPHRAIRKNFITSKRGSNRIGPVRTGINRIKMHPRTLIRQPVRPTP